MPKKVLYEAPPSAVPPASTKAQVVHQPQLPANAEQPQGLAQQHNISRKEKNFSIGSRELQQDQQKLQQLNSSATSEHYSGEQAESASSPAIDNRAAVAVVDAPFRIRTRTGIRRCKSNPFPKKLFDMLQKEDASIVSWLSNGDAFIVRNKDDFVANILPRYFDASDKMRSFQRQLLYYGFNRDSEGVYRHDLFHRDKPNLIQQITRSSSKPADAKQSNSTTTSEETTTTSKPTDNKPAGRKKRNQAYAGNTSRKKCNQRQAEEIVGDSSNNINAASSSVVEAIGNMNEQQRNTFYTSFLEDQYKSSDPLKELYNHFLTHKEQLESQVTRLEGQKDTLYRTLVDVYTKGIQEKEQAFIRRIENNPGDSDTQQLQLQHNQNTATRKEELIQHIHHYQGQIQQEINALIQSRDRLTYEYESLRSSIIQPPGYEQIPIPSVIPGASSGYCERVRTINGSLPYSHQYIMTKELQYRRLGIQSDGMLPRVNGVQMPHKFKIDMFIDNPNWTKLFEDDPVEHAYDNLSQYMTQVVRDKYIMEWLIRNGKVPLLLRYLHRSKSTNRVPNNLILWFIQLMACTEFLGESNSVVVLVSVGPFKELWHPKARQYAHTFSEKGGCRVLICELYEVGGKPKCILRNCSNPAVLQSLMNSNNGDMSTAPHTIRFGYFSPSKHGTDESCANYLEAGEFRLERLAVLLAGLILPVGENDEDVTMNFETISGLLGVSISFVIQEYIDEVNRRKRVKGSPEIPWSSMDILYSRGRQYWEDRLASDCLVEHNVRVDENERRCWSFTSEDVLHLIKVFKRLQNTQGIPNNLRDILVTMDLYPKLFRAKNLSETAAELDLCMWMSLAPEESVPNERRDYGPPEDVVTKVLQFVFSEEYFAENTKKGKRVTTFNTETGQFGNSGMVEVGADVDADQGTVGNDNDGVEVAAQQPIVQNQQIRRFAKDNEEEQDEVYDGEVYDTQSANNIGHAV